MDRKIKIALFRLGRATAYSKKLLHLAEIHDLQVFSSQADESKGELHCLRFSSIQRETPYDLIIYVIADTREHADGFFYMMNWPGVIFLDSIELPVFSRAVSHSARDGWGFRWILGVVLREKADLVARLSEKEFDIKKIAAAYPLGKALALRSAATVTGSYREAKLLDSSDDLPPVAIIEKDLAVDKFLNKIDKSLPLWLQRMKDSAQTIAAVKHPHLNMFEVESGRIREKFQGQERETALVTLQEMFDKAGLFR